MSYADILKMNLISIETDEVYAQAVLLLRDFSRLHFCHRVGARWLRALASPTGAAGLAAELLAQVTWFRLNAKHLEVCFADQSRWEHPFRRPGGAAPATAL
jgi:hypothetical protein